MSVVCVRVRSTERLFVNFPRELDPASVESECDCGESLSESW